MKLLCLDLEGVLIPEIWLGVADRTGIEALRLTTRDIADYDELMQGRLAVLEAHGLTMRDVQAVIQEMNPLPGAVEFMRWARQTFQVAILSDTFYEFATPLMAKLDQPFLLCHRLEVAEDGRITGYRLRQPDPKRAAVKAFHDLRYTVLAAGDSFNDTAMLEEADAGFFFSAPRNVKDAFPQFDAAETYDELKTRLEEASLRLG